VDTTVLSPHLDDAVLSRWHVLEEGADVLVINVFTGSPSAGTQAPWWDRLTGADDPIARMDERREEDRRAMGLAGCDAVSLGFLDAQYGRSPLASEELVERMRTHLSPGTVIHAPAGLGGHPDHELVRDAALALARAGWPVFVYADLPHAIGHGWPAWVTGAPEVPGSDVGAEWAAVLTEAGLVVERLVSRVRPLDAQARKRKLTALSKYRSQRAALDGLSFVPLEDPRAFAFEVSWAVPKCALGSVGEADGELLVADAGAEPLDDRR
jgi:LmbE family N-acetylglucosaminyl deacetylase